MVNPFSCHVGIPLPTILLLAPLNLHLFGESQGPQVQHALIQLYCDESVTEVIPCATLLYAP